MGHQPLPEPPPIILSSLAALRFFINGDYTTLSCLRQLFIIILLTFASDFPHFLWKNEVSIVTPWLPRTLTMRLNVIKFNYSFSQCANWPIRANEYTLFPAFAEKNHWCFHKFQKTGKHRRTLLTSLEITSVLVGNWLVWLLTISGNGHESPPASSVKLSVNNPTKPAHPMSHLLVF